ncbi:hypothetical protein GCM10027567_30840 [Spongiibacter taiwanensis]
MIQIVKPASKCKKRRDLSIRRRSRTYLCTKSETGQTQPGTDSKVKIEVSQKC